MRAIKLTLNLLFILDEQVFLYIVMNDVGSLFYKASQIAAIPWPPPIQTADAPYFLLRLLNS